MSSGYDFEPKSSSPYLRLKSKGDKVKIRLASTPIHFEESFEDKETGEVKTSDKFAWVVIDRADGSVKAYKAGVMVYKEVKNLAENEDWGDPTGYDLTIERTEEPGRYYSVSANPKSIRPLSEEELALVKEANLDLEKMFKAKDEGTSTFGKKRDNEVDIDEIGF